MTEFDSVIPAGRSGTLTAKIKTTPAQSGAISKSVAVSTDAPGAERLTLSITFTAVTVVAVLPRPQVTLNGVTGDSPAPSASVLLRRGDGQRLEITGIENPDETLVFETSEATEGQSVSGQRARLGDIVLTVSTAPGAAPISSNGMFKVATNHPDAPTIDLAYNVRLRPLIEARPEQLRLLLQEGNSIARTTLCRIQHNRQGQFRLTGVTASNPDLIRTQLVDGDVTQQVHTVAVMLRDDLEPGDLAARVLESLVFSTDDPRQPEVEVPVMIEPRELRRPGQAGPAE